MARSIGRVVWVAIAFVFAVLSGLAVFGFVGLERVTAAMQGQPQEAGELGQWVDIANAAWGIGQWGAALSIVPALVAVLIGELAHIRSLVYWVAAGGMAAVAVPVLDGLATSSATELALPATTLLQLLATAGFAAGVVYWALAGRRS
ncbi:MAG: hypothetical protein U1E49_03395 [Hyphomicrobiaceae bacterium]